MGAFQDHLKIKVLIVEDSSFIASRIRRMVNEMSDVLVVGEAVNSKEALLLTKVLLPDVVLLDINIPGKNGIQVLQEIKQKHRDIKVIMLTIFSDTHYRNLCKESGADYFFDKTNEFEKIPDTLLSILNSKSESTTPSYPHNTIILMNAQHPQFKKVLLIDEDKVDIFISAKIMKSALFADETISFSSALTALNYLKGLSGEPDQLPELIFLDSAIQDIDNFLEEFNLMNDLVKARCIIMLMTNEDRDSPGISALGKNPLIKKIFIKPLTTDALKTLSS